eukprot:gene10861-12856_t
MAAVNEWQYPGAKNLGLEAFAVLLNSRKTVPWVMPKAIEDFVSGLTKLDYDPLGPAGQLWPEAESNSFYFRDAGQEILDRDTLQAFLEIVQDPQEDEKISA